MWDKSSVWYGCVVKADVNLIRIGYCTNIQDRTVITEAQESLGSDHDGSTVIGHHVTVLLLDFSDFRLDMVVFSGLVPLKTIV